MSSPSETVSTGSMSIDLSFLPSFMIEPLPKARSIWVSAASRALDLSMALEPSPTRKAGWLMIALHLACESGADKPPPDRPERQCTLFVLCSQYVLFWGGGAGLF